MRLHEIFSSLVSGEHIYFFTNDCDCPGVFVLKTEDDLEYYENRRYALNTVEFTDHDLTRDDWEVIDANGSDDAGRALYHLPKRCLKHLVKQLCFQLGSE